MSSVKICQLSPDGPVEGGLQDWDPIDPSDLVAGTPIQRGHIYHEDVECGYMVGVWDCTAMTEKFGPYPVNEFMFLLEGSVTMILGDGKEITINAGETFVIPKGLPCQWKQEGYVRKYFVIFENPGAASAKNVSEQGIILPRSTGHEEGLQPIETRKDGGFTGLVPTQKHHLYFSDASGQLKVGVSDSTPFETVAEQSQTSELIVLLEGSAIMTDDAGETHKINTGDTVYVPKGAAYQWKSTDYIRKIYCSFDPS